MKVFVKNLEELLTMSLVGVRIVDCMGSIYERNDDAGQLFENVFGVRPFVFTKNMYHDCGSIMSEYGTMVAIVGQRFIKFYGADNLFMDVQGE